jgi:elongator complex protein 6
MLDTGSARDVSGVMRITGAEGTGEGMEYLYYVAGDGGVKVFERGA